MRPSLWAWITISICSIISLRKSSKALKSLILRGRIIDAIENSPLTANQFEKWFFDAWNFRVFSGILFSESLSDLRLLARNISLPRRSLKIKSPKPKLFTMKSSKSCRSVPDSLWIKDALTSLASFSWLGLVD